MAEPRPQPPAHWAASRTPAVLAPDGSAVGAVPDVGLDPAALRELLRWMVLARRLDRECIALQRQGELTVYPGSRARRPRRSAPRRPSADTDFVWPTFRELAVALVRGVDPVQYLQYHRGTWHGGPYDPRATRFGPICIPIATQIAHAAGYALGQQLDGTDVVTIAYFGDGATSEGDFHEAANLAGVWRLPLVLFCQNNGWAISVPTAAADRRRDLAPRRGVRVPRRARRRERRACGVRGDARGASSGRGRGDGPTLIEAMTYRIGAHSTADDARRYRADPEVEAARAFDPIARFRTWLLAAGHADDAFVAGVRAGGRGVRARGSRGRRSRPRRRPPSGGSIGCTRSRRRRSSGCATRRSRDRVDAQRARSTGRCATRSRRTDRVARVRRGRRRERRRVPGDRRAPGRVRGSARVRHADQRGRRSSARPSGSASRAGARWSSCSSTRSPTPRSSRSSTTSRRCGCAPAAASTCRSRSASRRSAASRARSTTGRAPRRTTPTPPG